MTIEKHVLIPVSPFAVFLVGIYTFLWGLWAALPFHLFSRAHVYSTLAYIAPERVWGVLFMVCSLFLIYGSTRPRKESVMSASFVGFILWTIITISYMMGDIRSTGFLSAGYMTTVCAWTFLNYSFNWTKMPLHPE